MRPRRIWIYVLSVAAVLVPAAGIAYLGAVSYRDERGAVSAQNEAQRQAAQAIAGRIERAIVETLDEVERAVTVGERDDAADRAQRASPLGRHWFWIDHTQQLRVPRAAPATIGQPGIGPGEAFDRGVGCASGRLDDCERELRTRTKRATLLRGARNAEGSGNWAEAKRLYLGAALDDTEPEALLGLARVYTRTGEAARTDQALADLEKKYGDRTFKGISVKLVVATLRAEAQGPEALLAVAEAVLGGRYGLDPIMRLGVLARLRGKLGGPLGDDLRRRRSELDERVTAIRTAARAAANLTDEIPEVIRTATLQWRGRPAAREPARTLVYRRRADGGVIGIAVDALMLERLVENDPDAGALKAQAVVLAAGGSPGPDFRTIVQVPLGTELPHLSLAVVNPWSEPDPLDLVIRERSQRHVVYTSALAILLGLGLLATIRGAARARELAQLKSDFVSTVSHELKTPLTSIRMFAEMLEQGVAKGDAGKMARYHGVIVQESQRLGLLIANLLDYAQIERGTRRYTPSRQGIAALARQAVTTFETLRDPERIRNSILVEVSPDAATAEVDTDRDVVVQAVLNLVNNAAKYGGADNEIVVRVGAEASSAWIAVRDQGPGIPASEQPRIFREFYRSPEAYRSGVEGTGLGLALVKQHVEALGGSVELESVLGQGSTFTIKLPRLAPEVAA